MKHFMGIVHRPETKTLRHLSRRAKSLLRERNLFRPHHGKAPAPNHLTPGRQTGRNEGQVHRVSYRTHGIGCPEEGSGAGSLLSWGTRL